jgi:hypothetical protein
VLVVVLLLVAVLVVVVLLLLVQADCKSRRGRVVPRVQQR